MSKKSYRSGETLIVPLWLIFDSGGGVRMTRLQPGLAADERAMQLEVKLPIALFRTPQLKASIEIEHQEPTVPPIDLTAATDALKTALGCDVEVRVVEAVE